VVTTSGIRVRLRGLAVAALAMAAAALGAPGEAAARTTIFGFNEDAAAGIHGVVPDQHAGLVRTAGGNAIRTNLDWRLAEPQRDDWNERWWTRWREVYDSALARGVRPIFIIGFAPPWAREPGAACIGIVGCEMPPSPAMDVEWAEYAAEVALRFPAALIEVWNEPNTDDYWHPAPDPRRYVELLVLARHAIGAVSPRTEVASGGLLNVRRTDPAKGEVAVRDFLSVAYAVTPSMRGNADYVGLHPYPLGAEIGETSRFAQAFEDVRDVLGSAGDRTPILVTETGVSTADLARAPERRQTRALTRMHRRIEAMPDVAGVVYHRVVEPRDTSASAREHGYAWLRYGGSPLEPRPVYCRFVAAARRAYPGC
jgi:hypothetical protein